MLPKSLGRFAARVVVAAVTVAGVGHANGQTPSAAADPDDAFSGSPSRQELKQRLSRLERVYFPIYEETNLTEDDLALLIGSKALRLLNTGEIKVTNRGLRTIGRLTNLESLDIPHLAGGAPDTAILAPLQRLKELRIGGWDAAGVGDAIFPGIGRLAALEYLEVANADITGEGLPSLRALRKMSGLGVLTCKRFDGKHIAALAPLQLSELYLCYVPIHCADLAPLDKRQLLALWLEGTALDDSHPEVFADMPALETLELMGTAIGDRTIGAIPKRAPVLWLDLSRTRVTSRALSAIKAMPRLVYLNLSNCKLGPGACSGIERLDQLKSLNLNETGIGDNDLEEVAKLKPLEQLYISGNAVTDEGVAHLKALGHLTDLWVQPLHLSERTLSLLRAIPSLREVYGARQYIHHEIRTGVVLQGPSTTEKGKKGKATATKSRQDKSR
jgi:Leucine-rich repeat (LRR) protein